MAEGRKESSRKTKNTEEDADNGAVTETPAAAEEATVEPLPDSGDQVAGADAPPVDFGDPFPEPDVAAAEEPETKSGIVPFLWAALTLAALIGAGYATTPFWWPYAEAYLPMVQEDIFDDPRMTGLAGRVKALEEKARAGETAGNVLRDLEAERARFSEQLGVLMERLEVLETALNTVKSEVEAAIPLAEGSAAKASLEELSAELGRLEENRETLDSLKQRISRLEEVGAASGADGNETLSAAVADISQRLGALEVTKSQGETPDTGAQAVVLAVGQLREALGRSQPYTGELQALKAVLGDNAEMAGAVGALDLYADTGIPTLVTLRRRFEAIAGEIVRSAAARKGEDWVERTVNRLMSLVSVRRVGNGGANTVDGIVARTEAYLEGANLMAAVKEAEALGGLAAKAVAPWLGDARARLAAEKALTTLHVHAVSRLTPGKE
jgi:hypothetical protein